MIFIRRCTESRNVDKSNIPSTEQLYHHIEFIDPEGLFRLDKPTTHTQLQ